MRRLVEFIVAVTVAVAVAACSGEPTGEGKPPETDQPRAEAPSGGGGTIEAEVKYSGEPVAETVRINKDVEVCGKEKRIAKVAVGEKGGLPSAVVWVADGTAGTAKTGPKPALDQKGCEFRPHVLAMTPGEIDILNSDGILHNIHTFSSANPPVNKAQPKFKKVMTERFEKPEIIRVRCDVHSWMEGWIVVRPDPSFGVTDAAGVARIENVPAGEHTVEAWHPVLGKQARKVRVEAGRVSRVTFELKS